MSIDRVLTLSILYIHLLTSAGCAQLKLLHHPFSGKTSSQKADHPRQIRVNAQLVVPGDDNLPTLQSLPLTAVVSEGGDSLRSVLFRSGALGIALTDDETNPGDNLVQKLVGIQRAGKMIYLPPELIAVTSIGDIKVQAGRTIVVLPRRFTSLSLEYWDDKGGQATRVPPAGQHYRVTGPFKQDGEYVTWDEDTEDDSKDARPSIKTYSQIDGSGISGKSLILVPGRGDATALGTNNVFLITRTANDIVEQFVIPTNDSDLIELFDNKDVMRSRWDKLLATQIREGDMIEYTRIELLTL